MTSLGVVASRPVRSARCVFLIARHSRDTLIDRRNSCFHACALRGVNAAECSPSNTACGISPMNSAASLAVLLSAITASRSIRSTRYPCGTANRDQAAQ